MVSLLHISALILIVEDEALVRLSGVGIFADAGFRIIEATNSDEALEFLEADSDGAVGLHRRKHAGNNRRLGARPDRCMTAGRALASWSFPDSRCRNLMNSPPAPGSTGSHMMRTLWSGMPAN